MPHTPVPDFDAIKDEVLTKAAPEMAKHAQSFFQSSFDQGGFTDYGFIAWPLRKDSLSHQLMLKSRTLRDSIQIVKADKESIVIEAGRGIPYAAIHNTGGTIHINITDKMRKYFWYMFQKTDEDKWKWMALTKKTSLTVRIPQRQFMGDSETLRKELEQMFNQGMSQKIAKTLNKIK